ncbi:helix-turn-helix transcriptional regulator [Actinoplanes sp. NPDC051411]|uniref:helix-turn-helix transcriptional regulator n=1 Tax=Actinoplanes sp. NPDC051411 TaxID=3155522 RepID=UPI0034262D53
MPPRTDLAVFLRDRRSRVEPERVGLVGGDRRRVPGLRREEVAQLARLSVDYYARLEQGRQRTASAQVLRAVATALCLTEDERRHLFVLARVPDDTPPPDPAVATEPGVRRFVDALGDTPALVVGRYVDIVYANPAAAFLFTDFAALPPAERNGLRWMLLDETARDRYGDSWAESAEELAGMLRQDAGRYPGGDRLRALVDELTGLSPLFRRLWRDQAVSAWNHHRKTLRHPAFGTMSFTNEFVTPHSAPQLTVVTVIPDNPKLFRDVLRSRAGLL